jgi:murein DD-endopeptidase MepM/ murein hydrolase activator NlpD
MLILVVTILMIAGVFVRYYLYSGNSDSNNFIRRWLTNSQGYSSYEIGATVRCGDAPFIIPTSGFIGLLWRDTARPYSTTRPHSGLDIFGSGSVGTVPIYAAYDGYLTRQHDWHSTVIIRHDDPLQPRRRIWTYYTHMASRDGTEDYISEEFPAGTINKFVPQGTLLGYQGLYNPPFPIAMHLHFNIVTSNPDGSFKNEAITENSLDPSPYLGVNADARTATHPVRCDNPVE